MTQIHIFFHALEKGVATLSAKLPQYGLTLLLNQEQSIICFENLAATDGLLEMPKG